MFETFLKLSKEEQDKALIRSIRSYGKTLTNQTFRDALVESHPEFQERINNIYLMLGKREKEKQNSV